MYIGQTELRKRSVSATGRVGRSGAAGVHGPASVYNCRPLCCGYSVFIASLKRRKYQMVYKHWSPQQPVSASVPCELTSRK